MCERERQSSTRIDGVDSHVCVRERVSVGVCEREGERECVCVCVCV